MKLYIECGKFQKVGEFRDIEHAKEAIVEALAGQICNIIFISEWGFFSDVVNIKDEHDEAIKLYLQKSKFFRTIDVLQSLIARVENDEPCELRDETKDFLQRRIEELKTIQPPEKVDRLLNEIKRLSEKV